MKKMLTRRQVGRTVALGSLVAVSTPVNSSDKESKTFVFVHGTWHGGWVWRDVRNYLTKKGHKVFTPSLTGCGDRQHLMNPNISLETHIKDITNIIKYEELNNIVLVGHSFAGLVITGVADQLQEKIKEIVFLDALVPRPGRMSGISRDQNGDVSDYWLKRKEKFIDGYQMDFFSEYPMKMLVPEENYAQIEWLRKHITPHPESSWSDQLVLKNNGWKNMSRTFIHCIGQEFSQTSDNMIGPARNAKGWRFIEAPWSRNAMVTHPIELSDTLLTL